VAQRRAPAFVLLLGSIGLRAVRCANARLFRRSDARGNHAPIHRSRTIRCVESVPGNFDNRFRLVCQRGRINQCPRGGGCLPTFAALSKDNYVSAYRGVCRRQKKQTGVVFLHPFHIYLPTAFPPGAWRGMVGFDAEEVTRARETASSLSDGSQGGSISISDRHAVKISGSMSF